MTKEQIKQNAEEYACENDISICGEEYWSYDDLVKAHLAGAESRQPEIDKACELIKRLMVVPDGYPEYYELYNNAKQFLKEQGK